MSRTSMALALMAAVSALSACSTPKLSMYDGPALPAVAHTRSCWFSPCKVVVNVTDQCAVTVDVDRTIAYDKKEIRWHLTGPGDFEFTDQSIEFKGNWQADFKDCKAYGKREYRCTDENVNKVDYKYHIHVFKRDGSRCPELDPYIYNQ